MQTPLTNDFFTNNRQKIRAQLPQRYPVVLMANGTLQRTNDTTFPFQQESNFWYLTGLNEPDVIVVIHPDYEYLILPETNAVKSIFDGDFDRDEITRRSGITTIYDASAGWDALLHDVKAHKAIYSLTPEQIFEPDSRIYANPSQRRGLDKLRRRVPKVAIHDISSSLARRRMLKQPVEIAAIKEAVRITTETLHDVRSALSLSQFATEFGLEAAISHGFRSLGASGHAYAPIVASGQHATTLHYVANTGALRPNELIVVDVGAEYEHYAADITRTLSPSKPSPRQQAVLNEVVEIQKQAVTLLRPGTTLREYETTVAQLMGKSLAKLRLATSSSDIQAIRTYFPHASSHFLGLDVHDVGDYTIPLEENMVLTCEPGIYIPEEGIGVRIEDDIVITARGNDNISQNCSYDAYVL